MNHRFFRVEVGHALEGTKGLGVILQNKILHSFREVEFRLPESHFVYVGIGRTFSFFALRIARQGKKQPE